MFCLERKEYNSHYRKSYTFKNYEDNYVMLYVNTVVTLFYFKSSTTKILTGSINKILSAHDVVNLQFALHSGNLELHNDLFFLTSPIYTYNFNLIVQVAAFQMCVVYIHIYIHMLFCIYTVSKVICLK